VREKLEADAKRDFYVHNTPAAQKAYTEIGVSEPRPIVQALVGAFSRT
jgi:hypothetical protein